MSTVPFGRACDMMSKDRILETMANKAPEHGSHLVILGIRKLQRQLGGLNVKGTDPGLGPC